MANPIADATQEETSLWQKHKKDILDVALAFGSFLIGVWVGAGQ